MRGEGRFRHWGGGDSSDDDDDGDASVGGLQIRDVINSEHPSAYMERMLIEREDTDEVRRPTGSVTGGPVHPTSVLSRAGS